VVQNIVLPALPLGLRRRLRLVCGDMFDVPCSGADLLLVNATGLGELIFGRLRAKLEDETRPGTRIMCLSLPLGSPRFEELPCSGRQYRMSWGNCSVFFYQKR